MRFTIEAYENLGRALLISILDVFEKNPYSRIPNTIYKNNEDIRKEIGKNLSKLERFRRDPTTGKKYKKLNELI